MQPGAVAAEPRETGLFGRCSSVRHAVQSASEADPWQGRAMEHVLLDGKGNSYDNWFSLRECLTSALPRSWDQSPGGTLSLCHFCHNAQLMPCQC